MIQTKDGLAVTQQEMKILAQFICPANLSEAASVEALIPSAEEAMGGLDILVNNAGLTRDGLFMRMKDEDWDLVLRVNLDAAFRLSRAAIRGMMKKRWGRIVTITSVVGTTGNAAVTWADSTSGPSLANAVCTGADVKGSKDGAITSTLKIKPAP